ncbi:MAG: EamA family transporter [Lachnospiraceae bacterium]|nr:EamA family transporter [Lachnospiraceae bacterium]
MIYLLLAIACSAILSILMRISEKKVRGNVSMLAVNYLMCLILAGLYTGAGSAASDTAGIFAAISHMFPDTRGIGLTGFLGVLNGMLYLGGFLLLQLNIRKNGVVLSTTFMKLGLLVPIVLSVFLFGEMPEASQWIGFGMALVAIIIINYEKENTVVEFKAGLLILLLVGGITDAMAKIYDTYGNAALSEQFLFYTFGAAVILCFALAVYKKERPGAKEAGYGLLIGIPNYFSARFLLKAVESLPAVIVYPTYSVATIIVVTLTGCCIFKEKLGGKQWIGMGVILVALVLLNV